MTRRWKPKDWLRPGSRRWREAHGPNPDNITVEILKELYPADVEMRRPEWARVARKFGWMTLGHYYSIEPITTGQKSRFSKLRYESFPLFGMIKKGAYL